MAHLAGQHLASFLGQLALAHIEEDAEHVTANDALVLATAACRYPPYRIAMHDPKIDFVAAQDAAGRGESCPYAVQIMRVNASGQILEGDAVIINGHAPQEIGFLIQFDFAAVDILRPESNAGGVRRHAKALRIPYMRASA